MSNGIDGTWYNELGSWMVLQLGPDGRSLTGVYHSAVGHAVEEYILSGRVDGTPEDGQSLGWVVSWQNGRLNSHSVTAWSGQFRVVDDGERVHHDDLAPDAREFAGRGLGIDHPGQGCLLTQCSHR